MTTDTVSIQIAQKPALVFEFMADPSRMNLWSFGTWKIEIKEGVVYGQSLFDGSTNLVRIVPHADGSLIDYEIGQLLDTLEPRIQARVVAVEYGGGARQSGSPSRTNSELSFIAKRTAAMNDARWQSIHDIHKVELLLIKSLLESGYDHRQ